MSPEPRDDAELIVRLARTAGDVALRHQQRMLAGLGDLAVSVKTNPTDVVTAADAEAEERLVHLLRAERPDDSLVGEEGAFHQGSSGRTWVIDPIDGTYNFLRGSARWCSAVALVEPGADGVDRSVLGAVYQPVTSALVWGGPGIGVQQGQGNRPAATVGSARGLGTCNLLTYLHPPFHGTDVGDAWQRVVAQVATLRMTGSGSLDAVDVASGRADLLLHHSVPLWDSAPGRALIEGTGGEARSHGAGGVEWYVAGAPLAVAEAVQALDG